MLLFLVLYSREHFRAQRLDRLCAIERQMRILLAAVEVAGLAAGLENGSDLCVKIHLRRCRRSKDKRNGQQEKSCRFVTQHEKIKVFVSYKPNWVRFP